MDGWRGGEAKCEVYSSLAVTADDMADRSMYKRYEGRVGLFLKGKGVSSNAGGNSNYMI